MLIGLGKNERSSIFLGGISQNSIIVFAIKMKTMSAWVSHSFGEA